MAVWPFKYSGANVDLTALAEGLTEDIVTGYFWGPATSAAAFGHLGERERAHKAVTELLAIRPDFATTARGEFGKWFEQELVEHYVEGLPKAGLEIAESETESPNSAASR